jgi:dTDP-4-amino-4,6-dideoxygalactose transaminase
MKNQTYNKNLTILNTESIAEHWQNKKRFNLGLPAPLNRKDTLFFLYGRNALYAVLYALKKEMGIKNILFPAYSCGDEIQPAISLKYDVQFYKLATQRIFQIDLENLLKILKVFKGILVITHYLGFVQRDINIISNFCKKNGVILIEDCAHCLGTKYKNKTVGTFGDYSIFSLRKNMPLPHGGALVINNSNLIKNFEEILEKNFYKPSPEAVNLDLFVFLGYKLGFLKQGVDITEMLGRFSIKQSLHGPRLDIYGGYNLLLSNLAKAILPYLDWRKLILDKRKNYQRYLDYFKKKKLQHLLVIDEILNAEYPMYFPIYVKDSEIFYKKIKRYNISGVQPFWSHMYNFLQWKLFEKEAILKKGILVLPTNYFIGEKKLGIIAKELFAL